MRKVRIAVTEISVSEQPLSDEDLALVSKEFETAPASAVIRWAVAEFGHSLALAASFEDIVLIDLATKVAARTSRSSSSTPRPTSPRRSPSSTTCGSATGST